jgi:UDP-3-O-acyl N-acetylglucosamine deacetylase
VIQIGQRPQRTLARVVEVSGIGMVSGCRACVRFLPATAGSGVAFQRIDLPGAEPIPARAEFVTGSDRRTTLGTALNQVMVVEHVLAALAGMKIDNCLIEIDAVEPPGLDGSAREFVEAIVDGGVVLQTSRRPIWAVSEPLVLERRGATLSLHPLAGSELRCSYLLDYGMNAPIAPQAYTLTVTPEIFRSEIAPCRTFLLEEEANDLRQRGVGTHLNAADLLVFGRQGLIDNVMLHPDEPARHKVLDLIGDLSLAGIDLAGHVVAYRSGHPLNVQMAQELRRRVRDNGHSTPSRLAA